MLQTVSDIPFTSPLVHLLHGQTLVAIGQAQDTVGLADRSGQRLCYLRGQLTNAPDIGRVATINDDLVARLRGDICLVIGESPDIVHTAEDTLRTVTDMTHGRGQLLVMGKCAPDVLVKVCGIDFADKTFPNNRVAQTSLAKTRTTIIRHDSDRMPAYHLIVGYSLAEYVWGVVFDAMGEFSGVYVV